MTTGSVGVRIASVVVAAVVCAAVLLTLVVALQPTKSVAAEPDVLEHPRTHAGIQTVAYVGDSLTSPDRELTVGPNPATWTADVDAHRRLRVIGGWAKYSSTSTVMAQNVTPLEADILVILSGSNDLIMDVPIEQQAANLDHITATIVTKRVVIVALPPMNPRAVGAYVEIRNAQLQQLAADRGWEWFDPWGPYSQVYHSAEYGDLHMWATGACIWDGVHPTPDVNHAIGRALASYLV